LLTSPRRHSFPGCDRLPDALGHPGSASQVVNVRAIGPGIVITNDPVVGSINQAVTLASAPANDAGTPPTSYDWTVTGGGTSVSGNAANFSFTPTAPGLYTITLTANFGPGVSNTTTAYYIVTGGVPTTSIVGAPTTALEGTPITLAATADPSLAGTLTYAWTVTRNGALFATQTSTQGDTFTFTSATAGNYQASLTISNSAGASSHAQPVTIQVTAIPPAVSIAPPKSFTSGNVGTPITLTGSASTPGTNDAITSLQWSVYSSGIGKVIATGSGSSFTYTPTAAGVDVVKLVAVNSGGGSNTASLVIAVAASPLTLTQSGSLQAGTPAEVTATVPNSVPGVNYTFTWTVTGQTVPFNLAESGSTILFTPPLPGSYQVTATASGNNGSVYSSSQSYNVGLAPLTASIFGTPTSGLAGVPITLTDPVLDASRKGPFTYQWTVTKNGNAFTSQTGSKSLFTFTPDTAGSYQVNLTVTDTASNETATAAATSVTIPVSAGIATVAISGVPNSKTSVAIGQSISLTAAAGISGSTDAFTYQWSVFSSGAGQVIATGSNPGFSYAPTASGADFVTVTATDSVTHQVTANTVVISVAPAGVVSLQATGGSNGKLQVDAAQVSAIVNNPRTAVTYTYSWTATGIGFPYSASGSGTATGSTPYLIGFTAPRAGTYQVSVTATGSDGSTSVSTQTFQAIGNPLVVSIKPQATVPEGTAVTLGATITDGPGIPAIYGYVWHVTGPEGFSFSGNGPTLGFTPIEGGNYAVTLAVSDTVGDLTTTTASFQVTHVSPAPVIQSSAGTIFNGSTFTLNLSASVTDPGSDDHFTYNWLATPLPGTTSSGSTQNFISPQLLGAQQGSKSTFSISGVITSGFEITLSVTDEDDPLPVSTTAVVLTAAPNTTLTLTTASLPANATQVIAFAEGNAVIDATALPASITVVEVALNGHDTLKAGAGPAVLQGDSGFNSLIGGSGPDTLIATVADTLIGGTGPSNLFQMNPGSGEVATAGTQNNTLSFAGAVTPVTINLNQNAGQTQQFGTSSVSLTGAFQTLVGGNGNNLFTAAPNSTIYGGSGSDTLLAGSGSNIMLVAGSGSAQLSAGSGAFGVQMFGGTGNDTLSSSNNSSITIVGGSGNDTITTSNATGALIQAGTGNNLISSTGGSSITQFGGAGNDTLSISGGSSTQTGNDTLPLILQVAGTGNTTMIVTGGSSVLQFGGTGNDVISSSGGTSVTMIGGSGNDTLTTANVTGALIQAGLGNATLSSSGGSSISQFGGSGNDSLSSTGGSSVTMQGGTGNDTLSQMNGNNVSMQGGTGNSTVISVGGSSITQFGGSGNDSLSSSGDNSVTMIGGTGNDTLSSINGVNISMQGGSGNATLTSSGGSSITQFGGSGNDSLSSSGGSSVTMIGGTGNDTLTSALDPTTGSGASSITMFGGTGNDSLSSTGGNSVSMVGGSGNDTLSSINGVNVSMQGGNGNATLMSSGGSSITQFGGSGNDSLSSIGGSTITMIGGTGNDTLTSALDPITGKGASSITMFGGTGNDSLSSIGGNSITMLGGSGNVTLSQTNGSNVSMLGGTGNATLLSSGGSSITQFGGSGNDSLSSIGGSTITMIGGTGNDTLTSTSLSGIGTGAASITMFGGTGNDSLTSIGGNSITMIGGSGNDTLSQTNGNNVSMEGGSGNSTLISSGGSSITQFGGSGNDSVSSTAGSSVTMVGGTGNDTLSQINGSNVSMQGGSGNATLNSSGGSSITQFGGSGNDSLASTGGNSVTMVGGTGNDMLSQTSGTSVAMQGGSGNNTLSSSGGSSITQFGGSGNDSLSSIGGNSITMLGGSGNATLSQTNGSNVSMLGGSGNATLMSSGGSSITQFGGSGNDSLMSIGGNSVTMLGGTGNDTLSQANGSNVSMVGGTGNDTLTSTTNSTGASITMFGGTGNDLLASSGGNSITMLGGSGNDTLSQSNGSNVSMEGGSGNATLISSGGSSITQFGGSGNDSLASSGGSTITMIGGTGNDTLTSNLNPATGSGASSITMFGGSGDDSLSSTGGNSVTMIGGSGNDTMSQTSGSSILMIGGTGNATLSSSGGSSITQFGGSGNDSLSSTGGSTITMIGGSGNDTLSQTNGNNVSILGGSGNNGISSSGGISITLFGGTGNDTISSTGGNSVTIASGTGNDSLSQTNGSNISIQGGSGNDTLTSSNTTMPGNNGGSSITLFGGTGNDSLSSTGGNSVTIVGGTGNDTLSQTNNTAAVIVGGTGTDLLIGTGGSSITQFGGTGNDTLSTSGGNSVTMIGGTGNDSLSASNSSNTSMQGGTGKDTLTSSGGASITMFGGTGNDSLSATGGNSVTIIGGNGNDTLSQASGNSVLMIGGSGNDTLSSSGASTITMFGGSGNDSLASSGDSSVTIIGGSGNDTLTTTADTNGMAMSGGSGNDMLSSSGGTSITQFGGNGNDTLSADGGTADMMAGLEGYNVYEVSDSSGQPMSITLDDLATFGQNQASTDSQTQGINTILFPGVSSITLDLSNASAGTAPTASEMQAVATNITLALIGQFNNVDAPSGNNYIHGDAVTNVLQGDGGNDTLVGGSGPVTLIPGSGNDSLVAGTGGTTFKFAGNPSNFGTDIIDPPAGTVINALDFSHFDAPVTLNLASTATQTVSGSGLSLILQDPSEINEVIDSGFGDNITGNGVGDTFIIGNGTDLSTSGATLVNGANATTTALTSTTNGSTTVLTAIVSAITGGAGTPTGFVAFFDTTVGAFLGSVALNSGVASLSVFGASAGQTILATYGGTAGLAGSSASQVIGQFATTTALTSSTSGSITTLTATVSADASGAASPVGVVDFYDATTGVELGSATLSGGAGSVAVPAASLNAGDTITATYRRDNPTIIGGGGSDTFFLNGSAIGNPVINEPANSTNNTLNFYGFAGSVNLSLAANEANVAQPINNATTTYLHLTLSNPSAFNQVIGSPNGGTIIAGSGNDTLIGGGGLESLVAGSGDDYLQAHVNQVVYLEFPAADQTPAGDHVYTTAEETAILQGMQTTYADFNYAFTLSLSAARQMAQVTGGQFITQIFNAGAAGGSSNFLDPHDLTLSGTSLININPFMDYDGGSILSTGSTGEANIIGLSTTIAAHELGHLSGLQHQDAFGPIGSGIYDLVNPNEFGPTYTGPENANQTPQDIMASPASVGSTLLNAVAGTYIGERDAVKLAFTDTGTTVQRTNLPAQAVSVPVSDPSGLVPGGVNGLSISNVYALGNLPGLAVPNTLPAGATDSGMTFNVTATDVNATLSFGKEEDFYAFNGHAGEVMNFQVISNNNTLNANPFAPELLLVSPSGQVIAYNQHEFESSDSTLLDVTLPADGTYYVGVDSLNQVTTGNYQLFMYSFATSNTPSTAPGDTLVGGTGNDTMVGSTGNDVFQFASTSTGSATKIIGGSGQDLVNESVLSAQSSLSSAQLQQSSAGSLAVEPAGSLSTTTTLVPLTAAPLGQAVTLTATVAITNSTNSPTGGSVTFVDQTTGLTLGSAPLTNGQATLSVPGSVADSDTIAAVYTPASGSSFQTSSSPAQVQTVTPAKPTVSVSDAGGTYSGLAIAATATVTGVSGTPSGTLDGVAPTLTYYADNNSTLTPLTGAPINAGSYAVQATFPGDANYTTASSPVVPFTIGQYALSYTIGNVTTTYGTAANLSANLPAAISGLGGQTLDITYSSLGGSATANAGNYDITGTISDGTGLASNYAVTLTRGTLTVQQAQITILIPDYNVLYDGHAHTETGTATGIGNVDLSADLNFSGTTHTNAGTYLDPWTFHDPNGNYADANGNVTDIIRKADAVITVSPYGVVYNGSPQSATGTTIGVLGESLTGLDFSDTAHTNAGTYANDTWAFSNPNYNSAGGIITDNIGQATAHITVTSYGVTYDGSAHTATGTATGAGGVDLSADLTLSGTAHINAGTYGDTWTFTDPTGNYISASGTAGDSIGKARANITVTPYGVTYNGSAYTATGSALGLDGAALSGLNLSATAHTHAGSYSDSWTFTDSSGNYYNASGTVSDSIGQYALSYTIGNDSQTYGTAANLATDLPSSITGVNGETLAISYGSLGDSVTAHAGNYDITGTVANGSGQLSDYSVTLVKGQLTVNPYQLAYQIGNDSQIYGTPANLTADLLGSISTGINGDTLNITYASRGDNTTTGVGNYDITGTLSNGSGRTTDYSVTLTNGSLTINPFALDYTIGNDSQIYGTAANLTGDLSATINTKVNGESLAIAYGSTGDATTADVGTYSINGTLSDGSGKAANYAVTLTDGVLSVSPAHLTVTVNGAGKTYGQTFDPTTFTGTISGIRNSDLIAATYASSGDAATAAVGPYAISATLSDSGSGKLNDYVVDSNLNNVGTLTVQRANANISVTGYGVTYDGNAHTATGTATGLNGKVNLIADLNLSGTTHTTAGTYGSDSWTFHDPNGNFADASSTVSDSIAQDGTTTALSGSVSGSTVTLAATVTGSGQVNGSPTGTVTFKDTTTGSNLGSPVTLSGGSASLSISNLPTGSQTITAIYSGDGNFLTSTSNSVTLSTSGGTATTLYVLNSSSSGALTISGNAHINVPGAIAVDSTSSTAVIASGNAILSASGIQIVGGYGKSGNAQFNPTPKTGQPSVADPYAGLGAPSVSGLSSYGAVTVSGNSSLTIGPGIYSSITVSGNGKLSMTTGTYEITGAGFSVSGNGIVSAANVLIYNTGSSAITLGGDGQFSLSALTSGPDAGLAIYQSPLDTQALTLSGNNLTGLTGSIYAKNAALNLSGNAQLQDALVVGSLNLSGNAIFNALGAGGSSSSTDNTSSGSGGSQTAGSGTPVAVVFASGPEMSAPGQTSGAITVQLVDANGNATRAGPGGVTLTLASTSGTSTFLDASGNPLSTITIPAGASSASFTYADATAGFPTLTVAGSGFSAEQEAIVTGAAAGLIVTSAPQTLTVGQTSGTMTAELVDASGDPAQAGSGGVTLTLGSSSGAATFFNAAGNPISSVTVAAGSSTASFEYQDRVTGNPTITLSGNGLSTSQQETITASPTVYTPAQVRSAYGINSLATPLDGSGQTIAVVDAYDNPLIYQSLDAFDQQLGTASGPTLYQQYGPASSFLTGLNQDGGTTLPGTDPAGPGGANWEAEEALDVEWIHAVAPGAHIVLVEANSESLSDLMTATAAAAHQPGVSVVSMSWGFPEGASVLAQDEARYDSYFTTPAGHIDVTFVASTGDFGAAVPEYPALSPNVVAVGGTSLFINPDGTYNGESGFGYFSNALGEFIGGGGGISMYEAEPSYQLGVQSTGSRTSPDVSFVADPSTGAWVADPYNLSAANPWEIVGGTSLSAPAWAGLFALVDQGRVDAGKLVLGTNGPTEALSALYGLSAGDFHDVTTGFNGYSAGPGYDLVTGLGTPAANLLIPDLVAYSGGPASTTPVAAVAPSGLVYQAGAASGDAVANIAAMQVFPVESVTPSFSGPASVSACAVPLAPAVEAAHAVAPVAVHTARIEDPQSTTIAPLSSAAASAIPLSVAPPASVPANPSASAPITPIWTAAVIDVSSAMGVVPALTTGVLRPEMPGSNGGDVLIGGWGDDLLIGGEGRDLLVGGYSAGQDGMRETAVQSPRTATLDALMADDRTDASGRTGTLANGFSDVFFLSLATEASEGGDAAQADASDPTSGPL
jgi:Ca2+-binding RTX toxin-like protein